MWFLHPLGMISLFLEQCFAKAVVEVKCTCMCLEHLHKLFDLHLSYHEIDTAVCCSSKVSAVLLCGLLLYHMVRKADTLLCSFCEFMYSCDQEALLTGIFSCYSQSCLSCSFLSGKAGVYRSSLNNPKEYSMPSPASSGWHLRVQSTIMPVLWPIICNMVSSSSKSVQFPSKY